MKSLLLLFVAAATATSAGAVDLAAGAAKAQACFACHGPLGISAMPQVPSLAGQPDGFLQWQLVFFRGGRRASPVMQPIAEALKDDDIRNLAAFFAAQPPPPAKAQGGRDEALRASGLQLVRGNRCISCHKDDLSGTQATARLAGQREDYLLKALRDFKSGARTGGAMAAMQEVVAPFSDEQLRAIAHAIAHWPS